MKSKVIALVSRLSRSNKTTTPFLSVGNHATRDDGMCLLEAVAYHAGEPHSAHPQCASPMIASFGRSWNDALDDDQRQRLAVYIPRIVGSKGTDDQEMARSWMAVDWLVRTHTPAWLRLAGLDVHADRLAGLDPIVDQATLEAAQPVIDDAQTAAHAAVDAAWYAAWAATCAAAGDAAWTAARTATRAATRDAVWYAARTAAWAAARAAAGDALAATRDELIESAHDLLDRMLEVTES